MEGDTPDWSKSVAFFVPPGTPDNSPPIYRWGQLSELRLPVRSPPMGDRSEPMGSFVSLAHLYAIER